LTDKPRLHEARIPIIKYLFPWNSTETLFDYHGFSTWKHSYSVHDITNTKYKIYQGTNNFWNSFNIKEQFVPFERTARKVSWTFTVHSVVALLNKPQLGNAKALFAVDHCHDEFPAKGNSTSEQQCYNRVAVLQQLPRSFNGENCIMPALRYSLVDTSLQKLFLQGSPTPQL